MPRGKAMRRRNGSGTIVKLSGRRRRPYEVRVNTYINEWGYPVYDVLERFENRTDADIALAEYNRNPFDVKTRDLTFREVYQLWFKWKYENSAKSYSKSSISCTNGAYNKCASLHDRKIKEIRTPDMQNILDNHNLSHAYMEHIVNLLHQVFKYAAEYDIIAKDYSQYIQITKAEDDEAGIPFTQEEIQKLWQNAEGVPYADTVLILIYTGWRISELLSMHTDNVSLTEWTMRGGVKTTAGKTGLYQYIPALDTSYNAIISPVSSFSSVTRIMTGQQQKLPITSYLALLWQIVALPQSTLPTTAAILSHPC